MHLSSIAPVHVLAQQRRPGQFVVLTISTYSWYKAKVMEISYQKHLYEEGKSATIIPNPFDDKLSDLAIAVSSSQRELVRKVGRQW